MDFNLNPLKKDDHSIESLGFFVEGSPPGELDAIVSDIECLVDGNLETFIDHDLAFMKHAEQLGCVKLPNHDQMVIMSRYNRLEPSRYYDLETECSYLVPRSHQGEIAREVVPYSLESTQLDLIKSVLPALSNYTKDHHANPSYGVFPTSEDSGIAILFVSNKYSPKNFWNGCWRSQYLYDPRNERLDGKIEVDVHYYEDGNVRLLTNKIVTANLRPLATASDILQRIATAENKYQEELNRAFGILSEGVFKGLRRQLPITRQKIEWEKISSYRLGQDIRGSRNQ